MPALRRLRTFVQPARHPYERPALSTTDKVPPPTTKKTVPEEPVQNDLPEESSEDDQHEHEHEHEHEDDDDHDDNQDNNDSSGEEDLSNSSRFAMLIDAATADNEQDNEADVPPSLKLVAPVAKEAVAAVIPAVKAKVAAAAAVLVTPPSASKPATIPSLVPLTLIRQLAMRTKKSLNAVQKKLPEWERDVMVVVNVSANNNALLQITNAHNVVLDTIQVERSYVCCSQHMHDDPELHDDECMGDDEPGNHVWYDLILRAKDQAQPTAVDMGETTYRAPFQSLGSRINKAGHSLTKTMQRAIVEFRSLVTCDDCGNLFQMQSFKQKKGRKNEELGHSSDEEDSEEEEEEDDYDNDDDDNNKDNAGEQQQQPQESGKKNESSASSMQHTCSSCLIQSVMTPERRADCSICLESTTRFLRLGCGHTFHYRCISRVPSKHSHDPVTQECRNGRPCPNCRHVHTSLVSSVQ
jgi:hypothetical protein